MLAAAATGSPRSRTTARSASPPTCCAPRSCANTQFLQPVAADARPTRSRRGRSRSINDGRLAGGGRVPGRERRPSMRGAGAAARPRGRRPARRDRCHRSCPAAPVGTITFIVTVVEAVHDRGWRRSTACGGTLIFAGLIALAVSLVVGVLVARRLTDAAGPPAARVQPPGAGTARRAGAALGHRRDRRPGAAVQRDGRSALRVAALLEADRDRLREFVADVSHELRTPIAALRAFTELQRDGEVDEATRREFLDRSNEQISRLEWMSTNLLDLSRIDAGIFPLDMRPGDLRDPIRSVVEAHAELAEQRGVSLMSEVPPAPVMLPLRPRADRAAAQQPRRQRPEVHAARRPGARRP